MARKGGAGGIILLAVVLGLVASYLIWAYIRKLDEQSQKNWRPVVVARQDIRARTKVTREMLELRAFPKDLLVENAVMRIEQAENQMFGRDIRAKEQIRTNDFYVATAAPTQAVRIPEGMRAITIGADERSAAGNTIQPGDHVDILATYNDPVKRGELTKILMQNVSVLWVDRGRADVGKEGGASSSMTLAVKPEETELVAAADKQGALKITLRPVGDARVVTTDGVTTREFRGTRTPVEEPAMSTNQPARTQPVSILLPPSRQQGGLTIIRGTSESTTWSP